MTKDSKSYWFGPTALFTGFAIFFFGGIWLHFLALDAESHWLNNARTITFVVATLFVFAGVRRILNDGDRK